LRCRRWAYRSRRYSNRFRNTSFEIIVNAVTKTFRDQKEAAYQAARYLKSRHLTES